MKTKWMQFLLLGKQPEMDCYTVLKVIGEGSYGQALLVQPRKESEKYVLKEIRLPKVMLGSVFIFYFYNSFFANPSPSILFSVFINDSQCSFPTVIYILQSNIKPWCVFTTFFHSFDCLHSSMVIFNYRNTAIENCLTI